MTKNWRHKHGHGRDPSIGQATRMMQNLFGALLNYSHAKSTFYKKYIYTFQYVEKTTVYDNVLTHQAFNLADSELWIRHSEHVKDNNFLGLSSNKHSCHKNQLQ